MASTIVDYYRRRGVGRLPTTLPPAGNFPEAVRDTAGQIAEAMTRPRPMAAGNAQKRSLVDFVVPPAAASEAANEAPASNPAFKTTPPAPSSPSLTQRLQQPQRPITPTPTPTKPREKQNAFTDKDAAKYAGQDPAAPASLADRVAGYNRAADTYREIGEMREADSLGLSLEGYRRRKDARDFGRQNAAGLAERRMTLADIAASRNAQMAADAPGREAQQIANETARQVQDIYRQMAATSDPAEIERLATMLLATQGKTPNQDRYITLRGGQEPYTDPVTGQVMMRNVPDSLFDARRGAKVQDSTGAEATATSGAPPADGVYEVEGVGRVTVKGGKVYDEKGNLLQ